MDCRRDGTCTAFFNPRWRLAKSILVGGFNSVEIHSLIDKCTDCFRIFLWWYGHVEMQVEKSSERQSVGREQNR